MAEAQFDPRNAQYPTGGRKPRIVIVATGGTIAGVGASATQTATYRAGAIGVDALVESVPGLSGVARVSAEQFASIDSKDMTPAIWILLLQKVQSLLDQEDVDGIVITHGTDTLEETAFFLHLCLRTSKPVVITGAMRPSTSLSADGPANLFNAVTVAADTTSTGQGVLVVLNNQIHSARDVVKASTYSVAGFHSPEVGPLGWVQDDQVSFHGRPVRQTVRTIQPSMSDPLPSVEIVAAYAGASSLAIDAFVKAGVDGLVIAGTGAGSLSKQFECAVADASAQGVVVVRASRVGAGHVLRNGASSDDDFRTIAAGMLPPTKARVLLMLALSSGVDDLLELQGIFCRL
jgi:L-asparaginase